MASEIKTLEAKSPTSWKSKTGEFIGHVAVCNHKKHVAWGEGYTSGLAQRSVFVLLKLFDLKFLKASRPGKIFKGTINCTTSVCAASAFATTGLMEFKDYSVNELLALLYFQQPTALRLLRSQAPREMQHLL